MLTIRRKRVEQELRARARQQAAVAELGQRALSGTHLEALLDEAVGLVAQILEVEYAAVFELLPDATMLLLRAGVGWREDYVGHTVMNAGADSHVGYTLLSKAPVVIEELSRETRFSGPQLLYDHSVISGLAVIIHGRDVAFGVLGAYGRRRVRFSSDDIHFLQAISNVLAAAIGRKRTEEALQKANEQLTAWVGELERHNRESNELNEMGDLLQTCNSAEEAYAVITQSAGRLFESEAGAVCVLGASRNLVEVVSHWGEPLRGERVFPPDSCWALRRGRANFNEDTSSGLVCQHVKPDPPPAFLCVPMMAQGEAFGILHLQSRRATDGLTQSKQRLAVTLAEHVALALANLKLRETLRIQSIRDALTGLYNRRHMEESLERELRRAMRRKRPLGLIMFDIDHFKRFNDTYGHQAGDVLLREVGAFLLKRTREEDIACRYGGEEFIVIMPEANLPVTSQRAELLRSEIKQVSVRGPDKVLGGITLSAGVAVVPEHGATVDVVLTAADRALYRAKALGRDRTVTAGDAERAA